MGLLDEVRADAEEYQLLCIRYGEPPQYKNGNLDCYGDHATELKSRLKTEEFLQNVGYIDPDAHARHLARQEEERKEREVADLRAQKARAAEDRKVQRTRRLAAKGPPPIKNRFNRRAPV